jgi:hypothetical protein
MIYVLCLILGGLQQSYSISRLFDAQKKERGTDFSHATDGLVIAFFMGALFKGAPLCLIYWIIFE